MASKQKQQGGKGGRKIGRNKDKCKRYTLDKRREKNRDRRVARIERKLAKAAEYHNTITQ